MNAGKPSYPELIPESPLEAPPPNMPAFLSLGGGCV